MPHLDLYDLVLQSVASKTREVYKKSLKQFIQLCESGNRKYYSVANLDQAICDYIHH